MRKKNIVRVNESRLMEIISECVRKAVNEQFERVTGDFASITYLPIIDMYRVEWHDHIFRDTETGKIQTPGVRNSVRTKKFGSEEEAERYCQENNLKIVNRSSLKDVAFPDVRSIRPNVHPLMEGMYDDGNENENGPVFPYNLLGTHLKFERGQRLVFICGEYCSHYDDDDFDELVYDTDTKEFKKMDWSTRGAYSYNVFDFKYTDINDCDKGLVDEIMQMAKEKAKSMKDSIMKNVRWYATDLYPKKYSQKTLNEALEVVDRDFDRIVDGVDSLPIVVSLFFHCHNDCITYLRKFVVYALKCSNVEIKASLNMKPRKVTVYGQDFTGRVVKVSPFNGVYGPATKVGIIPDGGDKSVWAIIPLKSTPEKGETITINGIVSYETDRSITLSKAKRVDNIDPSLIVNGDQGTEMNEEKLKKIVSETVKKVLTRKTGTKFVG